MPRRSYTRDDVETHYGTDRPAVNVKVHGDIFSEGFRAFRKYEPDASPRFTEEWIRENYDDRYLDGVFWRVCEWEFEYAQGLAAEVLGVRESDVQSDGRSGGWLVATGLPDIDQWDAIQLAKWRRFERMARAIVADIPYLIVDSLYANEWETREDADDPGAEAPIAELIGGAA